MKSYGDKLIYFPGGYIRTDEEYKHRLKLFWSTVKPSKKISSADIAAIANIISESTEELSAAEIIIKCAAIYPEFESRLKKSIYRLEVKPHGSVYDEALRELCEETNIESRFVLDKDADKKPQAVFRFTDNQFNRRIYLFLVAVASDAKPTVSIGDDFLTTAILDVNHLDTTDINKPIFPVKYWSRADLDNPLFEEPQDSRDGVCDYTLPPSNGLIAQCLFSKNRQYALAVHHEHITELLFREHSS